MIDEGVTNCNYLCDVLHGELTAVRMRFHKTSQIGRLCEVDMEPI